MLQYSGQGVAQSHEHFTDHAGRLFAAVHPCKWSLTHELGVDPWTDDLEFNLHPQNVCLLIKAVMRGLQKGSDLRW